MSPAIWLFVFFLLIGVLTPLGYILTADNNGATNRPKREDDSEESDETEGAAPTDPEEEIEETDLESIVQDEGEQEEEQDETEHSEAEPSNGPETDQHDSLPSQEDEPNDFEEEFSSRPEPEVDAEEQEVYNDQNDPDEPSEDLRAAVEWLVKANTEAIHEASKRRTFLGYLRNFIRTPRAEGTLRVAKTPWRDESPNMSRLIGERFLVMTLGLSAYGNLDMDAHKQAFLALMGEQWSDDELETPLLYQSIGRLGLLTSTSKTSLDDELRSRLSAQTVRKSDPSPLKAAHYHSLISAVSPGEEYPFPRSDKGLSRLWHWDEHNPPLAELDFLPAVLHGLWIHYMTGGSTSQAANDFGAMLGNWWEDKDPSTEYFDENPESWRSILLTAWVILADQPIIWDQLRDRYEDLNPDNPFLRETTEAVLDWVNTLDETGESPEEALDREVLPPVDWIRPLATDLIGEHSNPPFEYPDSWCEQMVQPERPAVEDL